jgi:hypothetical protein
VAVAESIGGCETEEGKGSKLIEMDASRRFLYGILITVAAGSAVGRILSTQLVFEPSLHRDEKNAEDRRRLWPKARPAQMPTFSSNDRSR